MLLLLISLQHRYFLLLFLYRSFLLTNSPSLLLLLLFPSCSPYCRAHFTLTQLSPSLQPQHKSFLHMSTPSWLFLRLSKFRFLDFCCSRCSFCLAHLTLVLIWIPHIQFLFTFGGCSRGFLTFDFCCSFRLANHTIVLISPPSI